MTFIAFPTLELRMKITSDLVSTPSQRTTNFTLTPLQKTTSIGHKSLSTYSNAHLAFTVNYVILFAQQSINYISYEMQDSVGDFGCRTLL